MARYWKPVAWIALLIALVALWVFPGTFFANPGDNDAIALTDAEWPLVLLAVGGPVAAFAMLRGARGALVRAALGVFLLGVAFDLLLGLIVFGNTSNDRFGQLVFFPPLYCAVGLAGLVVGVTASGRQWRELIRGAGYGLALVVVFGAWTLARGSRDWLLAPYGFDILALVLVFGAALVLLATSTSVSTSEARG